MDQNPALIRSPLLKRKMPGLDALRGVAILGVLLAHGLEWDVLASPPPLTLMSKIVYLFSLGGWGVYLFFALSGFLITGILIDSLENEFYWRDFYVRRIFRIIPIFLIALSVFKAIYNPSWGYIGICLCYMANMEKSFHISGPTYGPLWSLAVEEQFYLIWPWAVKALSKRNLIYAATACVVLSPLLRFLSAAGIIPLGDVHTMTWLISDNFAVGALLAMLLRTNLGDDFFLRKLAFILLGIGILAQLGGLPFGMMHRTNLFGAAFQTIPMEFVIASLILFSLLYGESDFVLFWARPLRFLGYISYGLYLYHVLLFDLLDKILIGLGVSRAWDIQIWLGRFILESATSIFIAYLSRRYVEEYFLKFSSRLIQKKSL